MITGDGSCGRAISQVRRRCGLCAAVGTTTITGPTGSNAIASCVVAAASAEISEESDNDATQRDITVRCYEISLQPSFGSVASGMVSTCRGIFADENAS
jgi:hypothetical protein